MPSSRVLEERDRLARLEHDARPRRPRRRLPAGVLRPQQPQAHGLRQRRRPRPGARPAAARLLPRRRRPRARRCLASVRAGPEVRRAGPEDVEQGQLQERHLAARLCPGGHSGLQAQVRYRHPGRRRRVPRLVPQHARARAQALDHHRQDIPRRDTRRDPLKANAPHQTRRKRTRRGRRGTWLDAHRGGRQVPLPHPRHPRHPAL
mmetsp:Transcript_22731/g.71181  ORF Transcript_22731/g.71181 Transcript_22731/m.71181 type:complete len:205 (-) Transcript_22731:623-1237(-)